jgi:hypothetical protein
MVISNLDFIICWIIISLREKRKLRCGTNCTRVPRDDPSSTSANLNDNLIRNGMNCERTCMWISKANCDTLLPQSLRFLKLSENLLV